MSLTPTKNKRSVATSGSIARKLICRLLIIVFLGQAISIVWSFLDSKKAMSDDLREKVVLSGKQLAAVAVISRKEFDFTYLGQLIDELSKDEDMARIAYVDNGITVIEKKVKGKQAYPAQTVEIPVNEGPDKVGSIRIEYSDSRLESLLHRQIVVKLGLQAVIFSVIGFFIYYFFNRYVGKRLIDINDGIATVRNGDLTKRLGKTADHDELSAITEGVEHLIEWLSTTVTKIKSISGAVSDAAGFLNTTFKGLANGVNRQQISTDNALISIQEALYSLDQVIETTNALIGLSDRSMGSLKDIQLLSKGVQDKMDRLASQVNHSYGTISSLSHTSRNLSAMAVSTSDSMNQAASAVWKISESVSKIGGIVKDTTEISETTTNIISEKGIVSVVEAIETMRKIDDHVTTLSRTIAALGNRSRDISKMLDVIKEVTEQTKLLSLNAQILSGQAGESGKPFAVVAAEMKALSEKTAASTREIESIVHALHDEMSSVVSSAALTTEMVSEGKVVAERANDVLLTILSSSERSTEMVRVIESFAAEQRMSLEQISAVFAEVQTLIAQVNHTTIQEEKGVDELFHSFGAIRTAFDDAKNAYSEQSRSIQSITENLMAANEKSRDIADASHRQHEMNEELVRIMKRVIQIGSESLKGVQSVSGRVSSISQDIDALNSEVKVFKTG